MPGTKGKSGVYKRSENHKKKLSIASKGEKNPFFGKHHSEKSKKKISQSKIKTGSKHISGYERKLWHNNRRRIIKLGNGGLHTLGEWESLKAQYNWTCPHCGKKEPKVRLSRDHIIPLSKGGSDNIENIQPLCRSCNSRKFNR